MNTFIKKGLYCALLVGGLSLIGISAANAAEAPSTSGSDGNVSGSQIVSDVAAPVTLTGNAISVLGDSSVNQDSTAPPSESGTAPLGFAPTTTGSDGIVSGTQVAPTADAPVTVSDNAVSVLGDSSTTGSNSGTAAPTVQPAAESPTTTGTDSVLGGTQVAPVVTAPIVAEGNAISVIGDSTSTGGESTPTSGASTTDASPTTNGSDSTLGGSQVLTNLSAPVTVQGNAISVLGDSDSAGATRSNPATTTGATAASTSGNDSRVGGTQIAPLLAVPVSLSSNAATVFGDSSLTDWSTGNVSSVRTGSTLTAAATPAPAASVSIRGDAAASVGTENSSPAALNMTPLFGSTLANAGTSAFPFLALGLLLALAGLGLVLRPGAGRREMLIQ